MIKQGATSYALSYDDDHQRIKQCIGASRATSATYYLNAAGTMAEKFIAGATTTWRDYGRPGVAGPSTPWVVCRN